MVPKNKGISRVRLREEVTLHSLQITFLFSSLRGRIIWIGLYWWTEKVTFFLVMYGGCSVCGVGVRLSPAPHPFLILSFLLKGTEFRGR